MNNLNKWKLKIKHNNKVSQMNNKLFKLENL
jgi:hypothetical protein